MPQWLAPGPFLLLFRSLPSESSTLSLGDALGENAHLVNPATAKVYPGCAARPWAVELNAYGVRVRSKNLAQTSRRKTDSPGIGAPSLAS